MSDQPILVTGGRGMLASALRRRFARPDGPTAPIIWTDVGELDITNEWTVRQFVNLHRPSLILNCAGMTDVDGCEAKRDLAFAINARGVGHLARAANEVGAILVHISTDFIFSGAGRGPGHPYREDDATEPQCVYAESKLAGEVEARQAENHIIARTSWLYGADGKNFVKAIADRAAAGATLKVVGDQIGCPTYTCDLAEALWRLISRQARGTFHTCGSEVCSWFQFAQAIVDLHHPGTTVLEISSAELDRPAHRPAYSAMDCTKLFEATGYRLPGYHDALPRYLAEMAGPAPAKGSP